MTTRSTVASAAPRRPAGLHLPSLRIWIGPAITALALAIIVLGRPIFPIPSPGIPLLVTVAAAAVLGGIAPGLASAAITTAFVAVDASPPGQLFIYDPSQTSRLILNVGSAIAMAVMVGAIRNRLEAERDRAASQRVAEHERALTETAADAMITIDVDGTIRTANPATSSMFGYPAAQLIGRPVEDLLAPSTREHVARARERYVETGVRRMSWTNTEFTGSQADGREFPIEVSFGEYADHERYFTWIIRDVSARKALEDQLLQAQKMEAIGQLAGGVAHDFNNMLTAIGGFAELIAEDPDDVETRKLGLDGIRGAAERATALTRQLLAFSRRQRLEPAIVSLNETVDRIEPLLRRLIGEHVELVIHRDPDLWPVLADPSQLETVVMNLAINARDAMADGGTLTIETANAELDEAYGRAHLSIEAGEYVLLSVTDTGQGMDQETLSHIFEPFYTTKEMGRGTGLGLSSTYGVIRQSGGNVWVYSEPGQSTTFKVYLPRAQGVVVGRGAEPTHALAVGSGTVIVAEDEAVVRDLILVTLERYGYAVLTARDGREALDLLEREPDAVDILVSDVVMPRLGGLELVEQARGIRPGLPAILISGYSERLLPTGTVADDVVLIEKPFTARRLTEAIQEALARG